jgi:sugar lactone lactonase YvrE/DNA-binding IclR family transcriptional regulator
MAATRQAEPAPSGVPGAAALEKAFVLVDRIAASDAAPTAAELGAATGLPRSTLFRLLAALEARGYVRRDERARGWRLGFRLFELAQAAWSDFDLRAAALDELARLPDATGETTLLAILDGADCLIVGGADGTQAIRHASASGQRTRWWDSAPGLALVAFAETGVRDGLLDGLPASDKEAMRAAIELARGRGYAVAGGDAQGVAEIAAPILDIHGRSAAALALAGPAFRLDDRRLHALAPLLMASARRVSHNAGGTAISLSSTPRPGPASRGVRVVVETGALLGEAPYWSPRDGALWWIDMLEPSLHRWRPAGASGDAARWPLARLASAAVPRKRGGVILAQPNGLHRFDPATGAIEAFAHPESDRPDHRYNDAKCDPRGRLIVGTLDPAGRPNRGSLWRVDPDGTSTKLDSGFTVANGLAFAPDGRTLYFADSAHRTVYAYDYDVSRGTVGARRRFVTLPDDVKPDGLAVDADGGVWIAAWDGWRVERRAPDGTLAKTIRLPVPRPTSLAFGGRNLATLYVTSARARLDADSLAQAPLSGSLFAVDAGVRGAPVSAFAG